MAVTEPENITHPIRISSLQEAQAVDFQAIRTEEGRLERRRVLAHYDRKHPRTMNRAHGSYMCAYGHCLLGKKGREKIAARWFYLAALAGNREAQDIFKSKRIKIKGRKESECIRKLVNQWTIENP